MKTWWGVVVIAFKTNPLRVLLIQNKTTGNITPISGAVVEDETLPQAAVRELKEEVGWEIKAEQLKEIPVKHHFIYGSNKLERAGDGGINKVFLLEADNLPEPQETKDTKNPQWISPEEAKDKVTFTDLKDVLQKSYQFIPGLNSVELKG